MLGKLLKYMVEPIGIEPMTSCVQGGCSIMLNMADYQRLGATYYVSNCSKLTRTKPHNNDVKPNGVTQTSHKYLIAILLGLLLTLTSCTSKQSNLIIGCHEQNVKECM